ncbi:zinc-binding dehydrogenase [Streptomyces sp. CB01635]|uniref:zinc-binding dehydrogenase n=1 Tax=unclassified Streptomyces TaxID=2593676 RepID=UPI0018FE2D83|nr:zinc-binding dehydrogenase [Streptomyces sp. CB01635]
MIYTKVSAWQEVWLQLISHQVGLAATNLELMRADCTIPVSARQPGQRVRVTAIGTVIRSDSPDLEVGDLVQSMTGWSQYSAGPAGSYLKLDRDLFADPGYHLGQGPTAYYGMADVAAAGEGDVVFVSGAAGGVGSLAEQIAKCLGAARVIGSAGSPAKADYLVNELGYDAAFDHHDGPAAQRLNEFAPKGSLCSSTSWAVSSTTLRCRRPGARFALCGSLSSQLGDASERFSQPDRTPAEAKGVELLPFSCHHTPEQIAAWREHFSTRLSQAASSTRRQSSRAGSRTCRRRSSPCCKVPTGAMSRCGCRDHTLPPGPEPGADGPPVPAEAHRSHPRWR